MLLAVAVGAVVLIFYYINTRLEQSDAYKDALAIASSSREIQNILGSNIHPKLPALGHVESFRGTEFAEWSVFFSGTKGTGHLYGVANRVNGVLEYSRLVFASSDGKQRVDLAPVRALSLPRVPKKRVYLIPLGLAKSESLDWAPAYYKSKLGINVTVLPSAPLTSNIINEQRNQLDADKCLDDFLRQNYPQLASDPSALIVVVTSKDMYIPSLGWRYAENSRVDRFAVVSSARLHPLAFLEKMNPEWLNSRLQKLLTKNIAILYFDLPLSSDYTSLLSGGVLPGGEIDLMGGDIIGEQRQWDPFIKPGAPLVSIYELPNQQMLWDRKWAGLAVPDSSAQVFTVSLDTGIFVQREADFTFPGEPTMQFTRVYRNQDDRSRAFGIGGSHSFDMFLVGKMGVAIDLILAGVQAVHFVHKGAELGETGDVYELEHGQQGRFVRAVFSANIWHVKADDGWVYDFPYRPDSAPQYVTVLTGFTDPAHRRYDMKRDSYGSLLEVTSPSGSWLHCENDSYHRIRRITSSTGRRVDYEYNETGSLIRVTPSDGSIDSYSYDDKGQMLSVAHEGENPILINKYFIDGYIESQTMQDGQNFQYHYTREGGSIRNSTITDPNGLETYIQFEPYGYLEWPPASLPR